MVSFEALKEISTTSQTVLRYPSLAKDAGSLTFVSFKALEEISTTLQSVHQVKSLNMSSNISTI